MWNVIESQSADAVWQAALSKLKADRELILIPSRLGPMREILHAAITVADPRQRWVFSRRPALNPAFALAEVIWIMAGRRDSAFLAYFNRKLRDYAGNESHFHGAYGHRLRHHFGVDQLDHAYAALSRNPESRQVVLQLWDARCDLPDEQGRPRNADIPCNSQSILKIRNGQLEWLQIMRSNDLFLGLPHNFVQFTFIHEIVAGWLGVNIGPYHHVSDSLHLYKKDELIECDKSTPSQNPIGLSFSFPKPESDAAISKISEIGNMVIDEENNSDCLVGILKQCSLPEPFLNILRVLVAEGLRRRDSADRAELVMDDCSDKAFCLLWKNWIDRLRNK